MTIIAINTQTPGLVGDQTKPHRCTMVTTDDFGTVTSPGYLNSENKFGVPIENNDLFDVLYSFNQQTQQGTYGKFVAVYQNGGFVLQNAATTDIGIPTLTGQVLLNINSNGQSPLYSLDSISGLGSIQISNGVTLVNGSPAANLTFFAPVGNGVPCIFAAMSTNFAASAVAKIDQYPNVTNFSIFEMAIASSNQAYLASQVNDSDTTEFMVFNNITYNGTAAPLTCNISFAPQVNGITYNQPLTINKANKYNESSNGNAGVVTLVSGTATVNNTSITSTSRIVLSVQNFNSGTPGFLNISTLTAGTGFTITSSSSSDTSIVYYQINEVG